MKGYDFEGPLDLQAMLDAMLTSGFQARKMEWGGLGEVVCVFAFLLRRQQQHDRLRVRTIHPTVCVHLRFSLRVDEMIKFKKKKYTARRSRPNVSCGNLPLLKNATCLI